METIDQNKKKFNQVSSSELICTVAEVLADTEKMKELVESLLELAKPEEQAELKLLYNAMVNNANSYQADSTAANLKDWRESKNELETVLEKLREKYDQNDSSGDGDHTFSDIKSVMAYLQGLGYQISRAGLYKHHKEGKFSKDKKTGKFLAAKIDAYAKNHLPEASTGKIKGAESDALQVRKLKAETREREAKAATAEYDLKVKEGKYIDRDDMIRELVGRAVVLDTTFRHMIKSAAPEIIELVHGDPDKEILMIDELMAKLDHCMNTFASTDDFVVEFRFEEDKQ